MSEEHSADDNLTALTELDMPDSAEAAERQATSKPPELQIMPRPSPWLQARSPQFLPTTLDEFTSILSSLPTQLLSPLPLLPLNIIRQASDCYEEFGIESITDADKIRKLSGHLWKGNRLVEAEKLDRLTISLVELVQGTEHLDTIALRGNLACVLLDKGEYQKAEELQTAVIQSLTRRPGDYDKKIIQAKANLAWIHHLRGKWRQAESLSLEVISEASTLLSESENLTLTAKHNLARTYCGLRRWKEALALLKSVTEAKHACLGDTHRTCLHASSTLASTLQNLGLLDQARDLNERVIAEINNHHPMTPMLWTFECMDNMVHQMFATKKYQLAEVTLRSLMIDQAKIVLTRHPAALVTKHRLAVTLHHQSKSRLAIEIGREVLSLRKEILGQTHPLTIASKADLAWMERGSTDLTSFEQTMGAVLSERREILGDDNADTLESQMIVTGIHAYRGRWNEVERIISTVRNKHLEVYGKNYTPEYIYRIQYLAEIFEESMFSHKAEPLLRECVTMASELFGESHPKSIDSLLALASSLFAQARLEEAQDLVRHAVDLASRTYGGQHPITLNAKASEGCVMGCMGTQVGSNRLYQQLIDSWRRLCGNLPPAHILAQWAFANNPTKRGHESAEWAYNEAIEAACDALGRDQQLVGEIMCSHADLKSEQRDWHGAVAMYKSALRIQEPVCGKYHTKVLSAKSRLAVVLARTGDLGAGEKLLYDCLDIASKVYGCNHPATLLARSNLAWLLTQQSMLRDAVGQYREAS
jgi:tetratricopeptide (TPR) repeat protein